MIINEDNVGIRIDKYLTEALSLTRSRVQKMISNNQVLVNGNIAKNNYILKLNDNIDTIEYEEEIDVESEDIPLDILYEDNDVIVVNKPSGMVVHPALGNYSGTLVNALLYHNKELSNNNGEMRPGIVHRIDADTSGLLLVAKNYNAHLSLAEQIKNKTVKREYLALVHGIIKEDTATIDAPIGRDIKNRKTMSVVGSGKDSITHIKVLERYIDTTLIECVLETGRTHQIRVHMKYIGHPIVNDDVYGYKKENIDNFGQMLHAKTIGFIHPTTNNYLEFSVEPPEMFKQILEIYKEK